MCDGHRGEEQLRKCTSYLRDLYYLFFVSTLLRNYLSERLAGQVASLSNRLLKARHVAAHSEVVVLIGEDAHSPLGEKLPNKPNYLCIVLFGVDELGPHDYVVLGPTCQAGPVSREKEEPLSPPAVHVNRGKGESIYHFLVVVLQADHLGPQLLREDADQPMAAADL